MLIQADATNLPYPDKFFHACVTSPPYWGLRKYAGEQGRVWGGNPDCEHKWEGDVEFVAPDNTEHVADEKWSAFRDARYLNQPQFKGSSVFCQKCNAWYGGLGLEPTPDLHIQNMVEVFREVRRVLRDDGVCWLNYGDCFAGSGGENANTGLGSGDRSGLYRNNPRKTKIAQGSLMLMPHRLAIALQADGWIVRNDLVWFKRNPMPESCAGWRWERKRKKVSPSNHSVTHNIKGGTEAMLRDASIHQGISPEWLAEYEYGDDYVLRKSSWRHTRAHEYVFMLVKKPKYYCNQEAVREASDSLNPNHPSYRKGWLDGGYTFKGKKHYEVKEKGRAIAGRPGFDFDKATRNPSGRNPRSVLDVPTAPYKGAHYATFPPKLIAPLIRASVPRRCCPECGMAWAPVVEKVVQRTDVIATSEKAIARADGKGNYRPNSQETGGVANLSQSAVTDYRPTCECGVTEHKPGIVLDIFGGSGTTGMVAKELLIRWVVMDISRPYLDEQAKVRTGIGTPSKALEGLPMFGSEDETE